MEWHQIVDKVKPYVLKVETPRGFGTGFLFAYSANKNLCGVASAAHVVEHAEHWDEPIDITHFESGTSVRLRHGFRAVVVDKTMDTAAIVFPKRDLKLPDDVFPLIGPTRHLAVGVEIGWIGFPALAPDDLCFFSGRVSDWMQKRKAYFVDGIAINGVSGGPAFYYSEKEGSVKIVGVISEYVYNRPMGETLPGLLVVRDVTQLHDIIEKFKNIEEAKQKEGEMKEAVSAGAEQAPEGAAAKGSGNTE